MGFNAVCKWAGAGALALAVMASPVQTVAQAGDTVLKPADTQKLLPPSVYYKAQSASTNCATRAESSLPMASTCWPPSSTRAATRAMFRPSIRLISSPKFPSGSAAKTCPRGIYGVGFVTGGKFVVTDVGAHDLLTVEATTDNGLKRPLPLQVMADPAGGFRLYAGRKYVVFSR